MVRFYVNKGRYNLCSNKSEYCLSLILPADAPQRNVSEIFEDEPYIQNCSPSDVVELISERLESYWISTGRDEKRKTIEWCRENSEKINHSWAQSEIGFLQKKIKELEKYIIEAEGK